MDELRGMLLIRWDPPWIGQDGLIQTLLVHEKSKKGGNKSSTSYQLEHLESSYY